MVVRKQKTLKASLETQDEMSLLDGKEWGRQEKAGARTDRTQGKENLTSTRGEKVVSGHYLQLQSPCARAPVTKWNGSYPHPRHRWNPNPVLR